MERTANQSDQVEVTQQQAHSLGTTYQLQYGYKAETTYVAGEFYWPVQRGQTSFNRDYANEDPASASDNAGFNCATRWSVRRNSSSFIIGWL